MRQVPDHQIRGEDDRVRTLTGPHVCCFGDQSSLVTVFEADPDLLRGCEHQMPQLVQRLDPLLTGRPAGHHQDPYLFDGTVAGFRGHRRLPRQSSTSSRESISRVGLADLAAFLTVRTINLHHHDVLTMEKSGKTNTP